MMFVIWLSCLTNTGFQITNHLTVHLVYLVLQVIQWIDNYLWSSSSVGYNWHIHVHMYMHCFKLELSVHLTVVLQWTLACNVHVISLCSLHMLLWVSESARLEWWHSQSLICISVFARLYSSLFVYVCVCVCVCWEAFWGISRDGLSWLDLA